MLGREQLRIVPPLIELYIVFSRRLTLTFQIPSAMMVRILPIHMAMCINPLMAGGNKKVTHT